MDINLVSKKVYLLICLCGSFYHAFTIIRLYLRYDETNSISLEFPEYIAPPIISLCFIANRLMDIEEDEFFNTKLTMSEVFDRTPDVQSLVLLMDIRYPKKFEFDTIKGHEALSKLLDIEKFYMQRSMCYRIKAKFVDTANMYNYRQVAQSYVGSGQIFHFRLNGTLCEQSQEVIPIVHRYEYPLESRLIAKELNVISTQIKISYQPVITSKLEYPYPSRCHKYGQGGQSQCLSNCVIPKTLEKLGMFPYSYIVTGKSVYDKSYPIFQRNATDATYDLYDEIIEECNGQCLLSNCETEVYIVNAYDDHKIGANFSLFRVDLPMNPIININYQPMWDFPAFLTALFSCVGTWLGVAIVDLNPILLTMSLYNKLTRNSDLTLRSVSRNGSKIGTKQKIGLLETRILELEIKSR